MRRFSWTFWAATVLFSLAVGSPIEGRAASIPSGTQVRVRLLDQLSTGESRQGQTFTASIAEPVVVGGRTVLQRGSKVSGRVSDVVSSGRLKKPASITLELTSLPTAPLRIDGKSHLVRNAELIGGGAGAGAILGALAGGEKGAAIGAAVGAGAGTATAYVTGKQEIVLPVEMLLTFVAGGAATGAAPAGTYRPEPRRETSGGSYQSGQPREAAVTVFSGRDQEVIRRYYQSYTANLPPGLAKRGGNLPPGLERHLERDGTLPPGLQKRVQPFPEELDRQLPPLPAGCSRVVLGVRAMILDRNSTILDIMFIR